MKRTAIEFVQEFKYLGITMQPALRFNEHVNDLLTRTGTVILCLGDLEKLPMDLAKKIFELKIVPVIRYGMHSIAPRLSKSSMINLDRCKFMYFKAVLGLSRHMSNTFVLSLARENTMCESLRDQNCKFEAWGSMNSTSERKEKNTGKKNLRKDQQSRETIGGGRQNEQSYSMPPHISRVYHFKICEQEDYF